MASVENKVYRLRGIPEHLDRLGVAVLLGRFIPDGDQRDVNIASLASSCERWAIIRTKTATLSFKKLPEAVGRDPGAGEWSLQDLTLAAPLLLDDTFFGLSPLNDVPEHEHRYDCIIMSGLASHPMGSWQPHGKDKSFMWIRDALPQRVPNVRFILYGYDTKLVGSMSFQTVTDIALTFIHNLQQAGWAVPGPESLLFFAHSLGGIVLKEALRMLADSSVRDELILNRTQGAIFFGVPSQGLDVSDLQIMLQGQPNQDALVKQISKESRFVEILEEAFSGISRLKNMKLLWAYETGMTPTVIKVDGKYQRSGPGTVFVSPASATGQRYSFDSDSVLQINANHSDMVKFSRESELIDRIAYKLRCMLKDGTERKDKEANGSAIEKTTTFRGSNTPPQLIVDQVNPADDPEFWSLSSIIQAIRAPERDSRLEQIDIAAGHSFIWAFEKSGVGLTSWLQNDEKLFWISGKPASGKSTFMKYIYNNPLTTEYLRIWRRSNNFVRATFFFHHRGTAVQKSLEGLHRGILGQVLQQAPRSFLTIQTHFVEAYQAAMHANNLGSLSHDLEFLIKSCKVTPDAEILAQAGKVLCCEIPLKAFRTMITEPMLSIDATDDDKSRLHQVFLRQDELLEAYNKKETNIYSDTPDMKDILSEIKGSWAKDEKFQASVKKWLDAINITTQLSIFRNVLVARGSKGPYRAENMKAQLDDLMKDVLDNFSARKAEQRRIETAKWSPKQLSHTITLITNQRLIDLDLCIFLDALDEHDGPPDFISRFIKDIASVEGGRTRLKILFSSRPWQPFIDAFEHIANIQLHEFTENDIRELCLHTIKGSDKPDATRLLQLVEEIVKQARGVFLWVKLVLNDLLDNTAEVTASQRDAVSLSAALMGILKSLPADLEQYYRTIIERIPYTYRWEAFCLLEAVSKSVGPIYLQEMSKIILCARPESIKNIYPRILELDRTGANVYTKENLREHSRGLVETTGDDELQLLHQTLAEFIQLPEFKSIVLGDRCLIAKENGYTILSKYEALRQAHHSDRGLEVPMVKIISHYAQEAESTTGNSLYSSFSGVVWKGSPENKAFPKYSLNAAYTTLEVAIACGLKLLQQDALRNDKETGNILIFLLFVHMIDLKIIDTDGVINLIQAMVAQGLQIHASYFGLLLLMDSMDHVAVGAISISIDLFQRAMETFFKPGVDVEVRMSTIGTSITSSHFDDLMRSHGHEGTLQAIHIPTHSRVTRYLLENGADPNAITSMKMTPLDCWVKSTEKYDDTCDHYSSVASLLIQRGGRLNISTRREWEKALQVTDSPHFPLPFPGWLNGDPGTDTNGSQAKIPRRFEGTRDPRADIDWHQATISGRLEGARDLGADIDGNQAITIAQPSNLDTQRNSPRRSVLRKWVSCLSSRKGK
ncbi:hypothetical protein V8C35DRAFT_276650 [Trichoderma chlorosporum]